MGLCYRTVYPVECLNKQKTEAEKQANSMPMICKIVGGLLMFFKIVEAILWWTAGRHHTTTDPEYSVFFQKTWFMYKGNGFMDGMVMFIGNRSLVYALLFAFAMKHNGCNLKFIGCYFICAFFRELMDIIGAFMYDVADRYKWPTIGFCAVFLILDAVCLMQLHKKMKENCPGNNANAGANRINPM